MPCACGLTGGHQLQPDLQCYSEAASGSSAMKCLGESDAPRSAADATFLTASCDSTDASGTAHLFAASRCGLEACCPTEPVVPAGCTNALDDQLDQVGQCDYLISQGVKCEETFCATCGSMANSCDRSCGLGACAVCGDCWHTILPNSCDDGNSNDGDGCSSSCSVEEGWTCSRTQKSATNVQTNVGGSITVDICETCNDVPSWQDAQGFTCQDSVNK